jgi:hypothetical protein
VDSWSPQFLSMALFKTVLETFRNIPTPDDPKKAIPYKLIRVEDPLGESLRPLPKGFFEEHYFILNGGRVLANIDTGFHETEGLINFSFLADFKMWFSKRKAKHLFINDVVPYVFNRFGTKQWFPATPEQMMLIDEKESLVIAAKFYFTFGRHCFGMSVTDLKSSGL